MEPIFPSSRWTARLAGVLILVSGLLGAAIWWVTEMRPPLYMVLTADVSEVGLRVLPAGRNVPGTGVQDSRPVFAPGLRLQGLRWSGVRVASDAAGRAGSLEIDAVGSPFGVAASFQGTVDVQVVAAPQGRVSIFVGKHGQGRLRMEIDPMVEGCFNAEGIGLPPGWLQSKNDCARPSASARTVVLESNGDSRLEIAVGDAVTSEIFALPWPVGAVLFEQFDPQGDSSRRFVRSGTVRMGTLKPQSVPLERGDSLSVVPSGRFVLSKLATGPGAHGLIAEIVGEASSVRVGPDPQSRRDILPTRLEQWWQDEAFKWWMAGVGGLVTGAGFLLLQIVGWYHSARQIEAAGQASADLELRFARLERAEADRSAAARSPVPESTLGALTNEEEPAAPPAADAPTPTDPRIVQVPRKS